MKEVKIATYKTDNAYRGHNNINRYHWEVGFECYKVDYSEERSMGVKINGKDIEDTFNISFFNCKGVFVRTSHFSSREEANEVVKNYVKHGFKRIS